MRGLSGKQSVMLTLISLKGRVAKGHPLRRIKHVADQELNQNH